MSRGRRLGLRSLCGAIFGRLGCRNVRHRRGRLIEIGVPCPRHIWNPFLMNAHEYSSDERHDHPCQGAEYAVDTISFFRLRRGFHETSAKSGLCFLVTPAWMVDPLNQPSIRSIVQWWTGSTNLGSPGDGAKKE